MGWASEGWSPQKVALKLAELKEAAVTGQGESRLSEKREKIEAEKKLLQEKRERQKKAAITLDEYFKTIYYPIVQHEKKTKTHVTEEHLFRLWISPIIGKKIFKDVSIFDLERLKKNMLDSGKAPRTIEYCLTTLGQLFRHAEKMGTYVGEIPTTKIKINKYDNKRVRFLSIDESHILLEMLKISSQQMYDMALMSLHYGLRAGELFSLTWNDIDIEHNLIILLNTKSGKTRTLSMTNDVKQMLIQRKDNERDDFVFPAKGGGKMRKISKSFTRAVERAGFNDGIEDRRQRVTFHTLRHTFASWLVMEGISLYEVKELLGHSSLTMTERYSHLAPDKNRHAAETLGKIFKKHEQEPVKITNIL